MASVIPEKLFFKIGEVCELAGVQAHVLRYWETEFPTLAPQKNRAGQRTYRRRDVEMALRIKELLYDEQYTIAGAKKKLANELRGGSIREADAAPAAKPAVRSLKPPPSLAGRFASTPAVAEGESEVPQNFRPTGEQKNALRQIATELREILDLLDESDRDAKTRSASSPK
ncbi:MAG TPA: MerR family transcriptional regulator [Pyrinomonadaceae bacterium]|nr:MerR family transcriptional regulator [Pyrinomonadaceae bacterium]